MSKFKALFEEANQEQPATEEKEIKPSRSKKEDNVKPTSGKKGKRSNPNYTGVFAYVPVTLHEDVMIKLVRRKDLDFSGLVEDLLYKWLKEQK